MIHASPIAARNGKIVRNVERLTKDRAKRLVAAGIQRAAQTIDLDRLALAGGCSERCLQKALGHETLPSIDTLANMLDEDPSILTELFAAKGLQLVPVAVDPAADLATLAGLCDVSAELGRALADGQRIHTETLRVADKIRPVLPAMTAIVREADELLGHT